MRYGPGMLAALSPFALALALAGGAPGDAHAKWRGIAEADSRIVFAGHRLDAYRSAHRYLPFEENAYKHESYMASWRAGTRRLPVLWLRLQLLAPGRYFPAGLQTDLRGRAKGSAWFRGKPFSVERTGETAMAFGTADTMVFASGKDRCAIFRAYFDDGAASAVDTLGNTVLTGLYCPTDGGLDPAALGAVLSRIGVRGLAVPEPEPREAAPPGGAEPDIARLAREGDMRGLRRAAAAGFDPNRVIAFSHPRIARGREIERPLLAAAALFGHTEMVAFLLDKGASTGGRAAWAICAAIVSDRVEIVDLLLETDPGLSAFGRCGRSGTLSPFQLAMRLGRLDIAEVLRNAGG